MNQNEQLAASVATLQDALACLANLSTLKEIEELRAAVDAGFVADIQTVRFADEDWPVWTEAIRMKVATFEEQAHRKLVEKAVEDLRPEDRVDLSSCPFLKGHATAHEQYAVVVSVERESSVCVSVEYQDIDVVGYPVGTKLQVCADGPEHRKLTHSPVLSRSASAGSVALSAHSLHFGVEGNQQTQLAQLLVSLQDLCAETGVTFEEALSDAKTIQAERKVSGPSFSM